MTRDETIALYERAQAAEKIKKGEGRKVWSAWAFEMLRQKAELQLAGKWSCEFFQFGRPPHGYEPTRAWHAMAKIDFERQIFHDAEFITFVFPADATFRHATFSGATEFNFARFCGRADFSNTSFLNYTSFSGASFQENADFNTAEFSDWTRFIRANFFSVNFDNVSFRGDAEFEKATFKGDAWFNGATFEGHAQFDGATFEGTTGFGAATFKGDAPFNAATFEGNAWFDGATFEGMAGFGGPRFEGDAWFNGATFDGDAWFRHATFEGTTGFGAATFKGNAWFENACFAKQASFRAASSKSNFTLADARFQEVPDFIQATFSEAPRFDNTRIRRPLVELQGFWCRTLSRVKPRFKRDADESACYRALRGLALRGHDHENELSFFAEEIKSRRGIHDFPLWRGGVRYWAGWAYQIFSDFGRSLMRPLFWSAVAFASFTVAYLSRHMAEVAAASGFARTAAYFMSSFRWAWAKLLSCIPFADFPAPPPLSCASANPVVTAATEPWAAAVYVSIRRALIFSTGDDQDKLAFAYACLYGDYSEQMPNSLRIVPHIPDVVSALAISQSLLSAALIFLFLLAVRNQFRIK